MCRSCTVLFARLRPKVSITPSGHGESQGFFTLRQDGRPRVRVPTLTKHFSSTLHSRHYLRTPFNKGKRKTDKDLTTSALPWVLETFTFHIMNPKTLTSEETIDSLQVLRSLLTGRTSQEHKCTVGSRQYR